jgi:hypothetical protein
MSIHSAQLLKCLVACRRQVSREQLLDRYGQHTRHCPDCRAGLAMATRVLGLSKALLAASFLALCCLAGQFGVARLVGGGLPTAAAVAAVAAGGFAAWLGRACEWLERQFIFTDNVHADNH